MDLLDRTLPPALLGESPLWDAEGQHLYWIDTRGKKIFRYHPGTRDFAERDTPEMPGFIVMRNGQLQAGLADGFYDIDFETGKAKRRAALPQAANTRMNDGALDAQGRLWAGTMAEKGGASGTLYRLENGVFETVAENIKISNGLAWSPDGKKMYHADTEAGTIWLYDYDMERGKAENRRAFATYDAKDGKPDGICMDRDGNLYVALYGGGSLDLRAQDGGRIKSIRLPVPNVTSCAIGGEKMDRLFITTARDGMTEEDLAAAPLSGMVFMAEI